MVISYAIITHSFIQKDLMSENKKEVKTKKTRLKIPVLKLLYLDIDPQINKTITI